MALIYVWRQLFEQSVAQPSDFYSHSTWPGFVPTFPDDLEKPSLRTQEKPSSQEIALLAPEAGRLCASPIVLLLAGSPRAAPPM